jgi:hypothetical protein
MSKLPENEPDLDKKVQNLDSITAEQRYQGWCLWNLVMLSIEYWY